MSAADLVTLLRQHHAAGEQLSVGDIVLTPGAMPLLAAMTCRAEAELNARTVGRWLANHWPEIPGLVYERKRRGAFYRLAHVVRVSDTPAVPGPDADTVQPEEFAPPAPLARSEVAEAAPVDPEMARQLEVLAVLQAARPRAGWTLERLQTIEQYGNTKLTAKHAGRVPIQWPYFQQHDVAPGLFQTTGGDIGPRWPTDGAPIALRPWRI